MRIAEIIDLSTGRNYKHNSLVNTLKIIWLSFWAIIATIVLFIPITSAAMISKTGNLVFSPGPIEVIVGEPIETSSYSNDSIKDLMDKTRQIIISNYKINYPE